MIHCKKWDFESTGISAHTAELGLSRKKYLRKSLASM